MAGSSAGVQAAAASSATHPPEAAATAVGIAGDRRRLSRRLVADEQGEIRGDRDALRLPVARLVQLPPPRTFPVASSRRRRAAGPRPAGRCRCAGAARSPSRRSASAPVTCSQLGFRESAIRGSGSNRRSRARRPGSRPDPSTACFGWSCRGAAATWSPRPSSSPPPRTALPRPLVRRCGLGRLPVRDDPALEDHAVAGDEEDRGRPPPGCPRSRPAAGRRAPPRPNRPSGWRVSRSNRQITACSSPCASSRPSGVKAMPGDLGQLRRQRRHAMRAHRRDRSAGAPAPRRGVAESQKMSSADRVAGTLTSLGPDPPFDG